MVSIQSFDTKSRELAHEEFLNESLFTTIYDTIVNLYERQTYTINNTLNEIDLWDEARELVKKIFSSNNPVQKASYYFRSDWNKTLTVYEHKKGNQYSYLMTTIVDNMPISASNQVRIIIFEYAICMLISSYILTNNNTCIDVATEIVKGIKGSGSNFNLEKVVYIIADNIKNGNIVKDIDYLTQGGIEFDKSGNIISFMAETEVAKDENEEGTIEPISINFHDKVRLEMSCRLMENSKADFNQRGNKAEAARLLAKFLNLPLQTCKNYLTNRDLNTSEHQEEINIINTSLNKLCINFTL